MTIKIKKIFIFLLFIHFPIVSLAYNDAVHSPLSRDSVSLSGLESYLGNNLGIRATDTFTSDVFPTCSKENCIKNKPSSATGNFKDLIMEGALREDRPVQRTGNHFYDPTTGGKLTDGHVAEYALWNAVERATGAGNSLDWKDAGLYKLSWINARDYFYKALTLTPEADRNKNWGNLFLSLGNILHLLQDMAVPAHVRNDSHARIPLLFDDGEELYEKYCGINKIATLGYNAVNLPKLTDYWDTDADKGLAEFTNTNFFSRDSNVDNVEHVPYYSKPIVLLNDQGVQEEIKDDSGRVLDTVNVRYGYGIVFDAYTNTTYQNVPLTAYSLWDFEAKKKKANERVYSLNDKINKTQADFLLPRAVGYSAGLLNYFFRGKINIVQTGRNSFKIVNLSDENMSGTANSFKLYYDDTDNNRHEIPLTFSETGDILSIPSMTTSSFTATLNGTPVTPKEKGAYILVFNGTLGNEDGAVVGQVITPHFLTHVNVSGQWDVYEYDLLGNRIANVTGSLPRGISYYDGLPSPENPDLVLYIADSGCSEGSSCLHMLTKSTGQTVNFGKYGVFWWSKDGSRIYGQDAYYDFSTGTWNSLPMDSCGYLISYSSFSPDGTQVASEVISYNPTTRAYDLYDIAILTNWNMTHIVDINTRSVVAVDSTTCSNYKNDDAYVDAAPDFHPNSNKILFTSNRDGSYNPSYDDTIPYNVYVAEGGSVTKLTSAPAGGYGYYEATWSPDGERMLMTGDDEDGIAKIYLMTSGGGTPALITPEVENHYYPKWIKYLGQ